MNIYQLRSLLTKAGAKHFAKRVYHFSKRVARKGINIITNKKREERLIFTFGGRNDNWPTIGRDSYQNDANFRSVIKTCNSILTTMGGSEILSYFEGPANANYFDDESKYTCITAIQLATVKKYDEHGVYPSAVMGVSLGETAAAFAAGALTLKESLSASLGFMTIHKTLDMDYRFIFLNLDFDSAQEFCNHSPVWTNIIFEDSPHAVLIACHKDDLSQLEAFFTTNQLSFKPVTEKTYYPYHSARIRAHGTMLKEFHREIEPKPLRCDYYSPTLGRMIPKNTILPSDYWYNLVCAPVLFSATLKNVLADGYQTFLQIGPPAISDRQLSTSAQGLKIKLINTYQTEFNEIAYDQLIYKKLSKIKFQQTDFNVDEATILNDFKQTVNIYTAESDQHFEYLRKNGPIHFLPQHNAWLFLGYDDIENALKQPEVFSSSILKGYDPILLGADPDVHKVIRTLLQPLFSPAVISDLAEFTKTTAEELLTTLCQQESFDFVKDYADPLSLLALCNFFGLSSADANRMLVFTGKDYHNMLYWQRLDEFFNENFDTILLTKTDSLWGKLRELVEKEQFAFPDASSLLRIIWTAGMATTSALISTAINIAINDPELAEHTHSDEKLISKFIEECLRLQTSITSVHRITTQAVTIGTQVIPEQAMILLNLRSAMRDPGHYTNPHEFSLKRPAKKHLAFGTGIHQCIGMGIARAEARSALQVVLSQLPQLKGYLYSNPEYSKGSDLVSMTSLKAVKAK